MNDAKKCPHCGREIPDARFKKSSNGVVNDAKTGLEWCVGPNKDINHYDAAKWVANLSVAGGGWRLPTVDELRGIYEKDKITGKDRDIHLDSVFLQDWHFCWVWSRELLDEQYLPSENTDSPLARGFSFFDRPGTWSAWSERGHAGGTRVFAVRG